MESLQIEISKMKCLLITPYRSGQFFVKAVEKLGAFTVEKGFKAIRKVRPISIFEDTVRHVT